MCVLHVGSQVRVHVCVACGVTGEGACGVTGEGTCVCCMWGRM